MAYTYSKIASVTVGSGGVSSIDFLAIPQNYTDLLIKTSTRTNDVGQGNSIRLFLNNSTANFTSKALYGASGLTFSSSGTNGAVAFADGTTETASTFENSESYISNYAGSTNKSISVDTAMQSNNTSGVYYGFFALLWSNTAAINRITLTPFAGSFVQYSTATLYGIKAEV